MYSYENIVNYLFEIYNNRELTFFTLIPSVVSSLSFAIIAAPFTLADFFRPAFAEKFRINSKYRIDSKTLRLYLWYFFKIAFMQIILALILWPFIRKTGIHSGELPSILEISWQIGLFLIIDDFIFYWAHRILHTKWFYKKIHALHHKAKDSVSLTSVYFHPAEYLLVTASTLAGPVLIEAHIYTIYIWIIIRQIIAAEGHSGYQIPYFLTVIPGYDGTVFHDWHHRANNGNFGLFFGFWDKFFGTISPDYNPPS
jgi:4-alpha-methyl-delta7-sterol-4alpha-methyl oxidase